MNGSTFLAARRAPALINRQHELESIYRAIYHPEAELQIVLMRGAGGMGKSRLAEEVLWRAGNWRARQNDRRENVPPEWDWTRDGVAFAGDLIDMNDVRLQSRTDFLYALRNALVSPQKNSLTFPRYDAAYRTFETRAHAGDILFLQKLEVEAEQAFFQDYRQNAQRQRIVLVIDTIEKLYPIGGVQLLLREGLLSKNDLAEYTYQWLLEQIRLQNFPNTTLLLIGRAEEGKAFFEAIRQAATQNVHCQVTELPEIAPFSLEDTHAYFKVLVEAWQSQNDSPYIENIISTFKALLNNPGRLESLWRHTGGQPVRLALYADLIVEDPHLPESLLAGELSADSQLEDTQRAVEMGFARLLFMRANLRARILQALVRAPRGLNAEQLHYVLTSQPGESVQEWLAKHDRESEISHHQIQQELETLRNLALIKRRPDGRLALQDEVYRIYTRAIAQDNAQREEEAKERRKLYAKLQAWATYHYEQDLQEVQKFLEDDERQLRLDRPSQAPTVAFPELSDKEENRRSQVRARLNAWKMEGLHYALLADYQQAFNSFLFEEAQSLWLAHSERDLVLLQAERWQPLLDQAYALQEFGNLQPWTSLERRREPVLSAMKRIALQDDVTSWIKIFILRRSYERGIQFAKNLEEKINEWCNRYSDDSDFFRDSWLHTMARHERALWKNVAWIYRGERVQPVLEEMKAAVKELEALLERSQTEQVFPEPERTHETGFRGHPAEIKVRRLIALYYNYMGYGYANLGATTSAKEAYARALRAMREVEFPHMEATTRNNLSRVLSDRGHARGRRLCLDALDLRKQQGLETPIALSYNTLALIDNDHGRSDLAWIESAIAVAYFRRANDDRGLGLSLLQLGEALRRMANRREEFYHLRGDSPEVVLKAAGNALSEAVKIFTDGNSKEEKNRRVEAWIELGSLERDRMRFEENSEFRERYYRDAVSHLEQAVRLAQDLGNRRLELDARVNLAWTHYRYPDFSLAEETAKEAENLTPETCRLQEGYLPSPEQDDIYIYQQLSRLEALYGRIALENFQKRVEDEHFKKQFPDKAERRQAIHRDETVQQYLQDAAKRYVKAIAYAQLQSPRAHGLRLTYDALYERLQEFNLTELEDFYRYVRQAIEKYQTAHIKTIDMGRLDEFLEQTFGVCESPTGSEYGV